MHVLHAALILLSLLSSGGASLNSSAINMHGYVEKGYYIEVLIGTPPQKLNILIDTGSSNFAVASEMNDLVTKYYDSNNSSTVQDMNIPDVDIEYTEGFWKGHLVTDLVSLPDAGLVNPVSVDIVEITSSKEFFISGAGWQGILGLGYTELARPNNPLVKSFMESVVESSQMDDLFSMQLCGPNVTTMSDETSGVLMLGDFDRSLAEQGLFWTPITREWYYQVVILGMKVGDTDVPVECTELNNDKAIVDSGTTNLHLPKNVFVKVVGMIMEVLRSTEDNISAYHNFWAGKSVLCWDASYNPYKSFPILTMYLPSTELNNTISLYLHPEHYILFHGEDQEAKDGKVCYKFGISSSDTGTVLGAVVMEQYVVIFDRKNKSIGFSKSSCSQTSAINQEVGHPNATSCMYVTPASTLSAMQIAMYILLGIVMLCMIPVCVLMCAWCCKKEKGPHLNDTSELLNSHSSSE